jgi:peptidoglycan/LPS O-acetylase OafA/YrhL
MRAVAVLAVFADHLFDWPPGGFVGVDIFFVLSGFFITGLLIREKTTHRKLSFQRFYVRRVKRILPSALLVLTVTVICSWLLLTTVRAKETLVDALYAALFAANFRFQAVGADYFQQDQPPSPIQHYWSLSIEEQFYFVWPAVLVTIFALTRGLRRRGKSSARSLVLFGSMALVVSGSFWWALVLSASDPNDAYFSTFTRAWELGVGALVAIAGTWLSDLPSAVRPWIAYLGIAGVGASLLVIDSSVQFPAPWAALPVLSTALIVASFHGAEVRGMLPLTNPVARYIGDISYTLYLWHWPVIILLLAVLPRGSLFDCVAIILAFGLTATTYHFYENPIRRSNWLLTSSARSKRRWAPELRPSVWAGVGALAAASIVLAILGIRYDDKLSDIPLEDDHIVADLAAPAPDPCFGAPALLTAGCAVYNPEVGLQPSVEKFADDDDKQIRSKCWRNKGEQLKPCTIGYMGSDAIRIAFVGDSHAAALLPALRPYLVGNKWQLTTYIGFGCQWRSPPPENGCSASELASALLARPYDLVITTSLRKWGGTPGEFERAWAPVAAAGSRLAIVADNPAVSEDAIACLTRVSLVGDRTGDCGTPKSEAYALSDPLIDAVSHVRGATLIDLSPYYCVADRCPSVIGNVIVYRDAGGHLTATFARTLAPAVLEGIRRSLSAEAGAPR